MNKGFMPGWGPQPPVSIRQPRELARATNTTTTQSAITTITDLSGLQIGFSVTDFPVEVEMWLPYVYSGGGTCDIIAYLTDLANTITTEGSAYLTSGLIAGIRVVERITAPGAYSRKGRIAGLIAGNANTFPTANFEFWLKATEIKVAA